MGIIIFLLLAALLFGMNSTSGVVEEGPVETDPTDDTTEVEVDETDETDEITDEESDETDSTDDGTDEESDETTDEGTDTGMPLVGNNYDLVINDEGLNMTFESDGSLSVGEFMESYEGNYEITDEFLYVNIINTYYNETVALELTYDDLTQDVISGTVNTYELIVDDDEITEEELAEFNAQFSGLPYTLELRGNQ